jgi:hypothetical protein
MKVITLMAVLVLAGCSLQQAGTEGAGGSRPASSPLDDSAGAPCAPGAAGAGGEAAANPALGFSCASFGRLSERLVDKCTLLGGSCSSYLGADSTEQEIIDSLVCR